MVQKLGLTGTTGRQHPRDVGAVGLLLLLPILLIGGALSIPISLAIRNSDRKKERRFSEQMRRCGRTMSSESLMDRIHSSEGTIIREWTRMYKGPVRWWWTPNDFYKECPHASVDYVTMWQDDAYRPLLEWCWSRYTSPTTGEALLVELPKSKETLVRLRKDIDQMRLLDVPMAGKRQFSWFWGDRRVRSRPNTKN